MVLKVSRVTLLSNHFRLFPSRDCLRNKIFPILQRTPRNTVICKTKKRRSRWFLLVFTYRSFAAKLHRYLLLSAPLFVRGLKNAVVVLESKRMSERVLEPSATSETRSVGGCLLLFVRFAFVRI